MMYKSCWKLLLIQNFVSNWFLLLWYTTLEFLSFCVTRHLNDGTADRAVMIGKKVTYLAIWTVLILEKVLFPCFWVPQEINSPIFSKTRWQMFLISQTQTSVDLFQNGRCWPPTIRRQQCSFKLWRHRVGNVTCHPGDYIGRKPSHSHVTSK